MSQSVFSLEIAEDKIAMAARIIIDLSLDQYLDYLIPDALRSEIEIGIRVEVPVRNEIRKGYVIAVYPANQAEFKGKLKPIKQICEGHARIPESLITLGQWMAEYYCCSQESAIRTLLPGAVRSGKLKPKTVTWISEADPTKTAVFIETYAKRKKGQCQALAILAAYPSGLLKQTFIDEHHVSAPIIKSLVDAGILHIEEKRLSALIDDGESEILRTDALRLTPDQTAAMETLTAMMNPRFKGEKSELPHTLLLYGVTGSGKTEVYLQSIDYAIKQGKEAIVLVPEIALTPQTVDRFQARFGNEVSVLHSALSDQERYREWNKINDGKVKIAVGARSVLFAPFRNLGLIIVDEEHESTYKQSEAPRYHARDVAVMRGLKENAVVILGSATPSFESYANAQNKRYALARLNRRADDSELPVTEVADMRIENNDHGAVLFSKRLVEAIYDRLRKNEQTILFLNRRGFARQMMCDNCGYVASCEHCSVTYTYHKYNETLICHWCGASIPAPTQCPECHDKNIRYSGSGTEKIETVLEKLCPGARVSRMDSDTMTKAEDYENALMAFKRGDTDILLGTQMIAKGLHFPKVTLVGILNADLSLCVPDFRAEERTFQLLTQVAGRAGRGGIPGEVIVQTRLPDNPAIQFALHHDFDGFWEEESQMRKDLNYPPYNRMIAVFFRGNDLKTVIETAQKFHQNLEHALHAEAECTDPLPAPLERIKGKFRYLITVRGQKLNHIRAVIRHEICHGKYSSTVDIHADVDPVSIM